MSLLPIFSVFRQIKLLTAPLQYTSTKCGYAVAVAGAGLGKVKKTKKAGTSKIVLPVETDPQRLVTHLCGSNLLKEGGEDVKLKPDSEYPDWLWEIRLKKRTLEELSPDTKEYWRKVRKLTHRRNNLRIKNKPDVASWPL